MENAKTRLPFWNWIAGSSGMFPSWVNVMVSVPCIVTGYESLSESDRGRSCPEGTDAGAANERPGKGGSPSVTCIAADDKPSGLAIWIWPDPGWPSTLPGKRTTTCVGEQEPVTMGIAAPDGGVNTTAQPGANPVPVRVRLADAPNGTATGLTAV